MQKIPKQEFVSLLTRLAQDVPRTNIINGFKTTGIYDWEVQGVNKEAIPTSVFKTTDLERYKKNCPNPNAVPPEVATVPQEIDSHSTDTVPSEIAANHTDTAPLEVVATPTATMPQEVVSCLTDAVPPEVAVPPGGVPLQVEQASTSTVANPPGVASTSTVANPPGCLLYTSRCV